MTPNRWDMIFKVVTGLGVPALIGLFVWVWSTNLAMERLRVEFDVAQKEIEEMGSNSTDIKLIQKDIGYIKGDIKDIKRMLTPSPK